jgi:hypothetical protein
VLELTEEVKAKAAQRQRRLHLQTAYGNALFAARGLGAPETTEAHMGVFGSRGQVHRHIKNSGCCFGIQGLSPIS